jgi:hypothetical protein
MKSFAPKPWFAPKPVLIIGTYNKEGVANAMTLIGKNVPHFISDPICMQIYKLFN